MKRLGLAALLVLLACGFSSADPPRKPNVLFIAVDDLNNNLACYAHPIVKSPHIDRLAARGVRFDRAYCQYPLCNPSRTSFLSGKRPDSTRVLDNNTPPRKHLKDAVFLPEYFQKHGYFTAKVGKLPHGAFDNAVKWDLSEKAGRGKGKKQPPKELDVQVQQGGGLKIQWRASDNKDEDEPDCRTARRIVELLDKKRDKPFFIAAGFHKPHLPFVAPRKYFELYPPDKIALPREPADVNKKVPSIALTHTKGDDTMTAKEKKQAIAAYYACISFIDAQVGLLLDALDRLKLWDSTVVVFVSDHGFHLSDHGGLWRKMTLFEESARVPLIVAAPGKKSKAVSPRLVELVDLYPTLTDLCGLQQPEGMEGLSLAPLLDDPTRAWKKGAFTLVRRKGGTLGRTVRTERYRYTVWSNDTTAELYDHDKDPQELRNVAGDTSYAKTAEEMHRLLKAGWRGALPEKH